MFGVVPKSLWSKKYPADENNLCNWSMRCLLVEDGNRKILIDNGFGEKQDENYTRHFHLNGEDTLDGSLAKHGFTTDDITDVLLTHLHFDHCGGSIKYNDERTELVPAFKNANYWTSKAQWEWATNPNRREKASFLKENIYPIKESGQLNFIEEEGELFPNISVKFFNGHTKGQVLVFIGYKGRTVVFVADLIPSVAHIPLPWIMAYDMQPLVTLQEKESFLNEAVENDYILFFEHDIYHECCSLRRTEKGIREKETFALSEFFDK
jgi:glyoxylase-like metal-dependent hydrolase (beta-lactamase superfamily II)